MKNFFLLFLLLTSAFSYSQENESVLGKWKGNLDVGTTKLPLIFDIKQNDSKLLYSTMDSPSQKAYNIPVEKTTFSNNEITIEMTNMGISYIGKLTDDKINGKFYQSGLSFNLILEKNDTKTLTEK